MPERVTPDVQHECRALTRWLVGREPDDYVISRYARGLDSPTFRAGLRPGSADRVLAAVGRTGRPGLALAQTWARFFAPAGAFRRKAVLLGAILESTPPAFTEFEPPPPRRLRAWASLSGSGVLFGLRLFAALILIGPLNLIARVSGGRPTGEERPE
jgi:hypothetical protein